MSLPAPLRGWRRDDDREDVESTETWNGGDGTISLNYLQRPAAAYDIEGVPTPVEEGETNTTDPWNATGA